MAISGVLANPVHLDSNANPVSNQGLVMEFLQRTASGNSVVIYGADNTNADSNDLKKINTIVSFVISWRADNSNSDNDAMYGTISNTTTTNDTLTITTPSSAGIDEIDVWVVGYEERT